MAKILNTSAPSLPPLQTFLRRDDHGVDPHLRPFLCSTEYCDASHPDIVAMAEEIAAGCTDPVETSTRLFRWVQDEIRYSIRHNWSQTASETLAMRAGSCTNKANLYVALARARQIPAGFHVMIVQGKVYFGPVWIPLVQQMCSDVSVHIFATTYLRDRWVKCDPSDDLALTEGTAHINPPSERIDFDGENDAVLNIDPAHVINRSERLPSIDHLIGKRTDKPAVFFRIMDIYLEYGRRNGQQFQHVDEIEPVFVSWLADNHPEEYQTLMAFTRRKQGA
jgi:hypothetical protein